MNLSQEETWALIMADMNAEAKSNNVQQLQLFISQLQQKINPYKQPFHPGLRSLVASFHCDLVVKDTFEIVFFQRTDEALYLWQFQYPKSQAEPSDFSNWKEIRTYSRLDSLKTHQRISSGGEYQPTGKRFLYGAIEDPAFFDGDFKVVAQEEHYFLINLRHGAVYHLGPEKIEKVAQLQPVPEERTIRGRRLFIEDRDNGELIFFAPVSLVGPRERLPKMRLILTREAFEEAFGRID